MKQQRELSRESSRYFIRYTLFMGIQATTLYPPAGLPDPLLPELLGCCPCCGCCA